MNTRHVIGQRITRVKQSLTSCGPMRSPRQAIDYIELENGVRLYPHAQETEYDHYLVDMGINQTARVRRRAKPAAP